MTHKKKNICNARERALKARIGEEWTNDALEARGERALKARIGVLKAVIAEHRNRISY